MPAHRSYHPIPRDIARDRVAAFPRAFSLLELVLCLLIIASLAAIAVPRFGHAAARTRAAVAGAALAAEINRVRLEADAASSPRSISFRKSAPQFQVTNERGAVIRDMELPDPAETLIAEAEFGPDSVLVFNGFGTPANPGFVQIVSGSYSCRIDVRAIDGACAIGPVRTYEKAGGR